MLTHFAGKIRQNFVTIIQFHAKLSSRQSFNNNAFCSNFIFFLRHMHLLTYSVSLVNVRRLIRRIAFFFSMRRCSLLETNQRLRRTVLRTPLFTTFLRKRLSRESCDSPLRKFTDAKTSHLLSAWNVPRKETRPVRRLG